MKKAKSKACPDCRRRVPLMPDGTFAMHAKDDGSLCPATNCLTRKSITVFIGGVPVKATDFRYDPDKTFE